jgi:hypothetical protein
VDLFRHSCVRAFNTRSDTEMSKENLDSLDGTGNPSDFLFAALASKRDCQYVPSLDSLRLHLSPSRADSDTLEQSLWFESPFPEHRGAMQRKGQQHYPTGKEGKQVQDIALSCEFMELSLEFG